MGRTSDRLNQGTGVTGGGRTAARLQPPPEQEPGVVQSIVNDFARTPLKIAASLGSGVGAASSLIKGGVQYATGNKEGAAQTFREGAANIGKPIEAGGFLGGPTQKIYPGGYSDTGEKLSTFDTAKQAAGAGLELGLYKIPVAGIANTAIAKFFPSLAKTVISKGASTITGRIAKQFTNVPGLTRIAGQGLEFGTAGAGFQAARNLQDDKPVTENLGTAFAVGFVLPIAGRGAATALYPAEKAIRGVTRFAGSFGTPSTQAVSQEVFNLKSAYDDVFSARESTNAKAEFFKNQGKDPAEILSKTGIVPGLEYTNGKTIMRTKVEGGALDKVTGMIEERATQIQSTAEKIQGTVGRNVSVAQLEAQALQDARRNVSGIEMNSLLNKIKAVFGSIREKYGGTVGVGDMNLERIAANKLTGAWDRPSFERDAFSVIGNVFRGSIDDQIGDDVVRRTNAEIGDLIAARKLLETLDGKGIGGGRFTNVIASSAGAILGQFVTKSSSGMDQLISSVAGALGVKAFLRILQGNKFGGATTQRILSHLAENKAVLSELIAKEPQIVKNAWMREIQKFIQGQPKLLNIPKEKGNRLFISGDNPIPLRGATTFEGQAQNINYTPLKIPQPKK